MPTKALQLASQITHPVTAAVFAAVLALLALVALARGKKKPPQIAWILAVVIFLLGLGQGATLGLGIFYTMARAADPVVSASLSAFAQGVGYLIASAGPLLIGLLHATSGGWDLPISVLLVMAMLQLAAGWLAGRAKTIHADGKVPRGQVSATEPA